MRVLRAQAGAGRVDVVVALDACEPLLASEAPGVVSALRRLLPGVERHCCTSPASGLLASEIEETETAHLVEHAALELMVLSGFPRTVSGRTDWDFAKDGAGVYRIALFCDDPAAGEAAAREAAGLLSALLAGGPEPDVGVALAQVRAAREGGS